MKKTFWHRKHPNYHIRRYLLDCARSYRGELKDVLLVPESSSVMVYANMRSSINSYLLLLCRAVFGATVIAAILIYSIPLPLLVSRLSLGGKSIDFMSGRLVTLPIDASIVCALVITIICAGLNGRKVSKKQLGFQLKQSIIDNAPFVALYTFSFFFVLSAIALCASTYVVRSGQFDNNTAALAKTLISPCASAVFVHGTFPVVAALSLAGYMIANYYYIRHSPEAMIAVVLLRMLRRLRTKPGEWHKFQFRRRIASELELIASICERSLPRTFGGRNSGNLSQYQQAGNEIASRFRELQAWLYTPKRDTRDFLMPVINEYLAAVLLGDWDTIRKSGSVSAIAKPSLFATISNTIRGLVIAFLPLAVVTGYASWKPHTVMPEFYYLGAVIWCVVNLLLTLDPNFGARLTLFKDSFQILSGSKKE